MMVKVMWCDSAVDEGSQTLDFLHLGCDDDRIVLPDFLGAQLLVVKVAVVLVAVPVQGTKQTTTAARKACKMLEGKALRIVFLTIGYSIEGTQGVTTPNKGLPLKEKLSTLAIVKHGTCTLYVKCDQNLISNTNLMS